MFSVNLTRKYTPCVATEKDMLEVVSRAQGRWSGYQREVGGIYRSADGYRGVHLPTIERREVQVLRHQVLTNHH
jgi:hypothetical protein